MSTTAFLLALSISMILVDAPKQEQIDYAHALQVSKLIFSTLFFQALLFDIFTLTRKP